MITLDSFLQERDIGSVDLVKMDVETHEPEVLLGASQLFRRCRPVVFLEILASANIAELDAIRAGVDYIDGLLVEGGCSSSTGFGMCPNIIIIFYVRAKSSIGFGSE